MRFLRHLVFSLAANLAAIFAANYFIDGFAVMPTFFGFLSVAALLTAANAFLRPILKLILTPIIILTFGLFTVFINAALLYALDIFSGELTIEGPLTLVYATLVIGAVNLILHLFDRQLHGRP